MAKITIAASSAQDRNEWLKTLYREKNKDRRFISTIGGMTKGFTGKNKTGSKAIIIVDRSLAKNKGSVVRYDLVGDINADGSSTAADGDPQLILNDSKVDGFEHNMTYYQDTVTLFSGAAAIYTDDMDDQRTVHDLMSVGRERLANFFGDQQEKMIIHKLSGQNYLGQTNDGTTASFDQTAGEAAATNTDIIRAGGVNDDDAIMETHFLTASMIEDAMTARMQGSFLVAGTGNEQTVFRNMGTYGEQFVIVTNYNGMKQLRRDEDIKDAFHFSSVRGKDNPLYRYNDLVWWGCLITPHNMLYVSTANNNQVKVAHTLVLGSNAGMLAEVFKAKIKAGYDKDYFQQGLGIKMIMGFDKSTFNSKDFNVFSLRHANV